MSKEEEKTVLKSAAPPSTRSGLFLAQNKKARRQTVMVADTLSPISRWNGEDGIFADGAGDFYSAAASRGMMLILRECLMNSTVPSIRAKMV